LEMGLVKTIAFHTILTPPFVPLQAAASSFAVGAAAWPWGIFSDRIGRKPVILLGNCSTATCIVLFGLSGRYWQALLFRFLAGILDGSLV